MTGVTVGVLRETTPGENRVALDPEHASRLAKTGLTVLVEKHAGLAASFPDDAYTAAGATVTDRAGVLAAAGTLVVVNPPDSNLQSALRSGQLLVGLVDPLNNVPMMQNLADRGVTVVAFELLPRTVSRAQSMDAMSSQSSAAGYRAGVLAAASFGRYFPMMITASGTARPASVIVIGAGVAGLQAIGTVKRLGAEVTGYDVRPSSRTEVESVGGTFLTSSVAEGAGSGGYARAMTPEESAQQQTELADHLRRFDVIITTAKVPGHTPPLLVTEGTLAALKPGSVCIDLAATQERGNVAGSVDGKRTVTANGVIIIGAGNLASDLAASSSQMYAGNVQAILGAVLKDGQITVDPDDDIHKAVVVCHDGRITSEAVSARLQEKVSQ